MSGRSVVSEVQYPRTYDDEHVEDTFEVIFKKKKKSPIHCLLLILRTRIVLVRPGRLEKAVLMFQRNIIRSMKYILFCFFILN